MTRTVSVTGVMQKPNPAEPRCELERSMMSVADNVAAEIDRQVDFLHRCRSVFPRLHQGMAGQTEFSAPEYYRKLGYDVSVKLSEPMTEEFIDGLFELGHWLNENFVTRLWAILESN